VIVGRDAAAIEASRGAWFIRRCAYDQAVFARLCEAKQEITRLALQEIEFRRGRCNHTREDYAQTVLDKSRALASSSILIDALDRDCIRGLSYK